MNNGSAPPDPANFLNFPLGGEDVRVENAGCNLDVADPCLAPGAPTTVELHGSNFDSVSVHQTSTLIYDQGYTGALDAFDHATLVVLGYATGVGHDDSTVRLAGTGTVPFAVGYGRSTIHLDGPTALNIALNDESFFLGESGSMDGGLLLNDDASGHLKGAFAGDQIALYTNGDFLMTGGSVRFQIDARFDSNVSILGGLIGLDGGALRAFDTAHIAMHGGTLAEGNYGSSYGVQAHGNSTIAIYGGDISPELDNDPSADPFFDAHRFEAFDDATIFLSGSDFAIDGVPVGYGPIAASSGLLTGTLFSGDPLRGNPFERFGMGQIVLVPEPNTACLLALGLAALASRRRRERRAL